MSTIIGREAYVTVSGTTIVASMAGWTINDSTPAITVETLSGDTIIVRGKGKRAITGEVSGFFNPADVTGQIILYNNYVDGTEVPGFRLYLDDSNYYYNTGGVYIENYNTSATVDNIIKLDFTFVASGDWILSTGAAPVQGDLVTSAVIKASTDNRVARYDGTNDIQGSLVTIDDSGNIITTGNITGTYFYGDGSYLTGISGTGQTNTMTNLGAGEGVYYQKDGVQFQMKTLVEGDNITLTSDNNEITISGGAGVIDHGGLTGLNDPTDHIWASLVDGSRGFTSTISGVDPTESYHLVTRAYADTLSGTGQTNTMTNLGAGEGVYYQKDGVQFQMKSLVGGDNITLTADNDEITISGGGSLTEVKEDTSPELGGDLSMGIYSTNWDTSPNSDHSATGYISTETIDINGSGFGTALYMTSVGHFEEADASTSGTLPCVALALEDGIGNKKVLWGGWIRDDSWSWTKGQRVYLSEVTGAMTQTLVVTEGAFVQTLGIATDTNTIKFRPTHEELRIGYETYYSTLIGLTDTPNVYDDGKYLKSTAIGTEWVSNEVDWVTWSGTIDHNTILNYSVSEHRTINDSGVAVTDLWSAEKIEDRVTTATGSLTTDHGGLTGLADDDHTQYILVNGSRGFTSTVSGTTPTEDYHLTTKAYADTLSGTGQTNTMTNLGAGEGVYYQKSDVQFQMKSLVGGNNVILTSDNDTITINGGTDHSDLNELDYASAGHTGFAQSSHDHDRIIEGNTYVESVDTGTGYVKIVLDTAEKFRFMQNSGNGVFLVNKTTSSNYGIDGKGDIRMGSLQPGHIPAIYLDGNQKVFQYRDVEHNLSIGPGAGDADEAYDNIFIGYYAGYYLAAGGHSNIGIGSYALRDIISSDANVAIGTQAGIQLDTGSNNVLIGAYAGQNQTSAAGCVKIGREAGYNDNTSNRLFISNSSAGTLIYGEFDNNYVKIYGSFGLLNGTSVNEFSTDGTMAGNSDDAVPTEKAVKTYVDTTVSGWSGDIPTISGTIIVVNGIITNYV